MSGLAPSAKRLPAQERAKRMAAKLRELGIDPERM